MCSQTWWYQCCTQNIEQPGGGTQRCPVRSSGGTLHAEGGLQGVSYCELATGGDDEIVLCNRDLHVNLQWEPGPGKCRYCMQRDYDHKEHRDSIAEARSRETSRKQERDALKERAKSEARAYNDQRRNALLAESRRLSTRRRGER